MCRKGHWGPCACSGIYVGCYQCALPFTSQVAKRESRALPSALPSIHISSNLPLTPDTYPIPYPLLPTPLTPAHTHTHTHTHTHVPSFCGQVFTVDYLFRFWCAGEEGKYAGVWGRVKFTFSFFSLVDLVSIVRTHGDRLTHGRFTM